jgi:hypothetical protein
MPDIITEAGFLAALAGAGTLGLKLLDIETPLKSRLGRRRMPAQGDLMRQHERLARAEAALRRFGSL